MKYYYQVFFNSAESTPGLYSTNVILKKGDPCKIDRNEYYVQSSLFNNLILLVPTENEIQYPPILNPCFIPCPRCNTDKFTSTLDTDINCEKCGYTFRISFSNGNFFYVKPNTDVLNPNGGCNICIHQKITNSLTDPYCSKRECVLSKIIPFLIQDNFMKGQSLSYCKYFTKKEGEIQ